LEEQAGCAAIRIAAANPNENLENAFIATPWRPSNREIVLPHHAMLMEDVFTNNVRGQWCVVRQTAQ
jgi:hypothetical protein